MLSRRQAGSASWPDGVAAAAVAAMAGAVMTVWMAAWPGFPLMPAPGLAGAPRPPMRSAGWIERDGLPYAVADTALLPPEVRDTTTVLHRFGDAVVIERNNRGDRAACEDQDP